MEDFGREEGERHDHSVCSDHELCFSLVRFHYVLTCNPRPSRPSSPFSLTAPPPPRRAFPSVPTPFRSCTVGYDYMFRNARVRGTINSNWVVSAQVEEKLSPGFTLVMTGEVDNKKDEYKFGFGLTLEPMS